MTDNVSISTPNLANLSFKQLLIVILDTTLVMFLPLTFQFLMVRFISIFVSSMFMGLGWFFRIDFGYVPVIGFNADVQQFLYLNTISLVMTVTYGFVLLLWNSRFFERSIDSIAKVIASLILIIMGAEMIVFTIWINPFQRFDAMIEILYLILVMTGMSVIYAYYWFSKWMVMWNSSNDTHAQDSQHNFEGRHSRLTEVMLSPINHQTKTVSQG